MKKLLRIKLVLFLCSLTFFISGCDSGNPMMKEKYINAMKTNWFLDSQSYPIKACTKFYAEEGSDTELKNECNAWTQSYYRSLLNTGEIPSNTTLENFRDKQFWKAVEKNK